jgi:HK97 family phage prohead protease
METMSFRVAELKATPDDGPGTFRAIVSVFGTPDMGKDIVERGAFKDTLQTRGLPPIVWSHQWDIPPIGATLKAEERQEGLYIKGRLFVGEDEDSPVARAVYTAMKAKDGNGSSPLREFSFGYEAKDVEFKEIDGEQHRILKRVDLFEAGPTLVGMHPDTRLMGVKALADAIQELQQPPAAKEEPNDKPDPKPEMGEEETARINRLLAQHPRHQETTQ